MNKIKQLSVGKQVLVMFGTLCAILAAIGAFLFLTLRSIQHSSHEQLSFELSETELLAATAQNVGFMQTEVFRHILTSDPAEIRRHDQVIQDLRRDNGEKIAACEKFLGTEEEGRLHARLVQARKEYTVLTDELLAISRGNRNAEAEEFVTAKQVPAYEKYQAAIKEMAVFAEQEVRNLASDTDHRIARIRVIGDIFILIALLVAFGTGFVVTRVTRRLRADNGALHAEVTERKWAEEELKRSEERLAAAQGMAHIGSWEWDVITNEVVWSDEEYRLLGFTPRAFTPTLELCLASVHPDDLPFSRTWMRSVRANKESSDLDNRIVRPNGQVRVLHSRATVTLDNSGNVLRVIGTSQDITERKRSEQALQESEDRTKAIVESSLDCIVAMDHEGNILEFNPAAEKVFGYSRAEILGRELAQVVIPPSLRDRHRQGMKHYLATGEGRVMGKRIEITAIRSDGTEFPVELAITRMGIETPPTFTGFIRDISERKESEEKLKQSEERYRSIFEHSSDGIFQNTSDGRHLSVNPSLARMLGFDSPEELINERDNIGEQAYADPAMHERFKQALEENDSITDFEYEVNRKDGSKIWISENARVVRDEEGRVLYYEGSVQDITERKRAEAEREVISEIVQGVIATNNLEELLELAWHSIGKVLYAENCFVALHDPKTDLLDFKLWVDKLDPVPLPQPVADGLSGSSYVLRTGRPLLLTNQLKTALHNQGEVRLIGTDSPSWLGVPLRTRSRTIGVLTVQHYERQDAYSQRDLEFLSSVGDQIALAIERKQADEELKRSEERLAAAQKMAQVGSWEWDVITNEVVWSAQEYRLFGLEPDECEASYKFYLSLVHPSARRDAMRWFNAVRAMKTSSRMDIPIIRVDGQERILNSWADVVLDEAGNVVRVVGTSQDVTEREKAERALAQSEERFQLVSRATADAIWDWDMVGNKISFSESFGTLFGYYAGEFESTMEFWMNAVHPDDHEELRASLDAFIASPDESWSAEYRFRCADDSYAFVFDRAFVVRDAADKAVRMAGSMQDITAQKQAEEDLLVAKEAAEAASRAKSEFLANMSHEIRTPMNGIIGMTDLALETQLNRDQREYLGMVKSSAHSLLGLINDILDFSKIEAGKLELESIEFSLRDCVGGMLKPLGIRADQKGLELVADIHSDVPDQLIGDSMRLRQILINLTDNAIKFTQRGEIVVSVSSQSITDGESELHFSVSDTGIGIPPEKQAAIFEAFAQADGSTTRTYGGTGLGLSIASQLIQKMRGRIWIESNAGEGTTFHFTARLGRRETPFPVKHAEPQDLQGLRALVVDDNAVNRRMLSAMLLNWRMEPTVVESGASALEEMTRAANANAAYEIVLLDAMMPEMDGFALAQKINEQPALADATVMMLSSAMPAGTAERCSALGIAGWLSKPITQSELLDAILIAVSRDTEDKVDCEDETQAPKRRSAGPGLRILVAEDNLINRAVATGILEKAGHVLVHAANGREAVEAFSDGAFDVILMDVQMPEMDGFEATRRIRELEEATGGHIRIAAMTAHAMAGDRERCLAAGMDDYVSKPLRKEDLLRVLGTGSTAKGESGAAVLPYNRAQLLSQCDDDEELMSELVSIFHENTPEIVRALGEAVEKGDGPALATQAHKLLSSLGVFGAGRARTLALRLEKHGQQNDFGGAKERFTELERETHKIYAALA